MSDEQKQETLPDYYFDRVRVTVSLFGVNIIISLSDESPADDAKPLPIHKLATLRTSPIHAKVLAMMLRKQIKHFEAESGIEFPVPEDVFNALDLDAGEW